MMSEKQHEKKILLIEDNPADARLIFEAIKFESTIAQDSILTLGDGASAIEYLAQSENTNDKPLLIILDLNLPIVDGREVLVYIKQNDSLKHIPVLVLSSSISVQDLRFSYENHANCFIRKPVSFDEFSAVVSSIENFWLKTVTLPDH